MNNYLENSQISWNLITKRDITDNVNDLSVSCIAKYGKLLHWSDVQYANKQNKEKYLKSISVRGNFESLKVFDLGAGVT